MEGLGTDEAKICCSPKYNKEKLPMERICLLSVCEFLVCVLSSFIFPVALLAFLL